jgi:hypothetical protein
MPDTNDAVEQDTTLDRVPPMPSHVECILKGCASSVDEIGDMLYSWWWKDNRFRFYSEKIIEEGRYVRFYDRRILDENNEGA